MRAQHVYLEAFTNNKEDFYIKVAEIAIPNTAKYFFEISSIYGKITSIGGKTLEGKATVNVNDVDFDIEVTPEQEKALIAHYKKTHLLLTIRKKIDLDKAEVISASLEEYETVPTSSFLQRLKNLAERHPAGLFTAENEEDLVASIRN